LSISIKQNKKIAKGQGRSGLEAALGGEKVVTNPVQKIHIFAYESKRVSAGD